jgi:hypothetical protein
LGLVPLEDLEVRVLLEVQFHLVLQQVLEGLFLLLHLEDLALLEGLALL